MSRFLAAVAVIVLRGRRVLALRRSASSEAGAGLWEVVGGRVEKEEALLAAAERETKEETGLVVTLDPRPVDAYVMDRAGVPMVLVVYRAWPEEGDVTLSDEHDASAWWTAEEFRSTSSLGRLADAIERALA